jgi:2'-5' RNA ligase
MKEDHSLYFFAIIPPEKVQASVTEIKENFKDRYNAKHALKSPPHITLIPPFEYKYSEEKRLIENLELFSFEESSFTQRLENFGTFPPKVIYIRVLKSDHLLNMYERFGKFMAKNLGLKSIFHDFRKFKPHMTVAFRDLTKKNFYLAKSEYEEKRISFTYEVKSINLLRHNGKFWDIVHQSYFKQ